MPQADLWRIQRRNMKIEEMEKKIKIEIAIAINSNTNTIDPNTQRNYIHKI